jgi:PKD repeat protein
MRKFYLLIISMIAFLGIGYAQFQNCNAQFTTNVNNNSVYFVPVTGPDTLVSHYWSFGDGTSSVQNNPVHTYQNCGVFTVYHGVNVHNPNGVLVCQDSMFQTVTIACNTPCSAQAFFSAVMVNNQSNVFEFVNGSTVGGTNPVNCFWFFGDGSNTTTQGLQNTVHTYATSGVYNVCLIVTTGQPGTTNMCRDTFCLSVAAQVVPPAPCNLTANFTSAATSAPNTISFTNTSTGVAAGDSIRWIFGDGTPAGYALNPVHTYTAAGTYNVCLRISHNIAGAPPCVSEVCHTVVIQSTPCNLLPAFTIQVAPNQPNVVTFTNTTTPNLGLATWNFGDNTTATGNVISHTYTQAGTYNVCMHVQLNNTCGTDSCGTVVIANAPQPCNMIAGFTTAPTSAVNTIAFTNTSTGFAAGDSIRWTFGDGSSSFDLNPTHTYAAPGTYQVCLRVKKNNTPAGTAPCVAELCYGVVVGNPCNLAPVFTYQSNPNQPGLFVFNNTTITANAPLATWNFGDSTTGTGNVISHIFPGPGTYTVCMSLTVNNTCSADTCITLQVGFPPCNLNAAFGWMPANAANSLSFINNSIGLAPGDSIRWNFGDGSTSAMYSPVHQFANPGIYDVCLRVKKPSLPGLAPCVSEICHTVIIPQTLVAYPNPASNVVNVSVDLSVAGPIYAFLYNSQNVLLMQQIVTGISGNNVVTFNTQQLAAGYYTIRLYYNGQYSTARFLKL